MSSEADRALKILNDYGALTSDELKAAMLEATPEEILRGPPGIMAAHGRNLIQELKEKVGRIAPENGPGPDLQAIYELKKGVE